MDVQKSFEKERRSERSIEAVSLPKLEQVGFNFSEIFLPPSLKPLALAASGHVTKTEAPVLSPAGIGVHIISQFQQIIFSHANGQGSMGHLPPRAISGYE